MASREEKPEQLQKNPRLLDLRAQDISGLEKIREIETLIPQS